MITAAYAIAAAALLLSLAAALYRAIVGPTVPDRVLALNACGTVAVLLIVTVGYLGGRPEFIDLALVYALINFIGTIALLKFFQFGDLGFTESAEDEA